ncbi:hypothetical protein C474_05095 [Halogeometricum pallidum JCM 14848]|uniref:DUF1616 domain-containing protein n=1 Tax=Halogeometricum pallidum JCM 14848 TaxID=1227487 RepID=M0DGY4_HALPD|nr:DUF1616 domain-containing protein [Halogeometricum pallidum]ELZ33429.1 hypothetical protein C474_05095 [Halogeometricum pallidum JCM 14848]
MVSRSLGEQAPEASAAAAFLDLAVAAVLAVVGLGLGVAVGPSALLAPITVVFGALYVLVLPGYALTAALFPARSPSPETLRVNHPTVSAAERAVLAVGLSLMATPLVVLGLNFTEFGITRVSVLVGLFAVVAVGLVAAAVRRARVPPRERFRLPLDRLSGGVGSLPKTHLLIAVFLLASAGFAGATLAEPQNGERYTELYLLTDNGENGTLVADQFPSQLSPTEPRSIYVGIGNQEERTVEYSVVTELQRIETVDGERRVAAESELERFSTTLQAGQTFRGQRKLTSRSSVTGERLRLIFLLYRGSPPENPTEENAYRSTHIWVNATAP